MYNQSFKTFWLLSLMSILGITIFFSCQQEIQEDDIVPTSTEEAIEIETREIVDCSNVKEICFSAIIHTPGPVDPIIGFVIKDPTTEYVIQPMITEDEDEKSFSVRTEGKTYILSNTQDEFYRSYNDESIVVPNFLYDIFNLDFNRLTEGSMEEDELRLNLDGDVISTNVSGYRVVEYTYAKDDSPPPSSLIIRESYCSNAISRTANAVARHLLPAKWDDDERNQWRYAIRTAVSECADEHGCIGCIDQSCILEKLEDSMGKELAEEMRVEYLMLLLDTDLNKDFLLNNPATVDQLLGLYGIKSPFDNCIGLCGGHGAMNAYVNILALGVDADDINTDELCTTYTSTYNLDEDEFDCLHAIEAPAVQHIVSMGGDDANFIMDHICDEEAILEFMGLAGDELLIPFDVEETNWDDFDDVVLPTFSELLAAFPKNPEGTGMMYGAHNRFPHAGGQVDTVYNSLDPKPSNTCALWVCIGLNAAGVDVPHQPGKTLKGADGKNYFLNARWLFDWADKKWPKGVNNSNYSEHIRSTFQTGDGGITERLKSKQGIGIGLSECGRIDPFDFETCQLSGHADAYDGKVDEATSTYKAANTFPHPEVHFWELD